jgi:hypothetical protein
MSIVGSRSSRDSFEDEIKKKKGNKNSSTSTSTSTTALKKSFQNIRIIDKNNRRQTSCIVSRRLEKLSEVARIWLEQCYIFTVQIFFLKRSSIRYQL